jgi:hypothetical protein
MTPLNPSIRREAHTVAQGVIDRGEPPGIYSVPVGGAFLHLSVDRDKIVGPDTITVGITVFYLQAARFSRQAVARNTQRHESVQSSMLLNDTDTVAVEVPIVLMHRDVEHYQKSLAFAVPLPLSAGDVYTGHIDVVQIRNGQVHILDYKPDAKRVKPIEQLMIYALALARLTGLRVYDFRCAWFDDQHYYEFYALHIVRPQPSR